MDIAFWLIPVGLYFTWLILADMFTAGLFMGEGGWLEDASKDLWKLNVLSGLEIVDSF